MSSLMGGAPQAEAAPAIEYDAYASSPIVSGEVKLAITGNSFMASALFDTVEIPFAEVNAIRLENYIVTVEADSGVFIFSRMGSWCQPFYDALCEAYNRAVLRSLFVDGLPILTAAGEHHYMENGRSASVTAPLNVYDNCVVLLPPDLSARRVPLCFAVGLDRGDYQLTLTLATGESYTFAKTGYETAPLADTLEKRIRKLREKSLAAVLELDPSLTASQASQLAKLIPEGVAAPIGKLSAISASFASVLEDKLSQTRTGESYRVLKCMCDPANIYIGIKKREVAEGSAPVGGEEFAAPPHDPYQFWLIVPSPDGEYATVEFSEADSATFVYHTGGDFDAFARQLNRALEAISFRREVIRLSDEELRKPGNEDYYMAAKRTASLQFVRAGFVGRVIHSNPETWKKKLLELWSAAPVREAVDKHKLCGQCGAQVTAGTKFCGICGAKL